MSHFRSKPVKTDAPIELEPLNLKDRPQRHVPSALREETVDSVVGEYPPVPSHPAHACPNCDYNLTGLTRRRCPECGEPFTLSDARGAATALSEPVRRLVRRIHEDRIMWGVGIVLLIGSFLVANASGLSSGGRLMPRENLSWQGFLMLLLNLPLFLVLLFLRSLVIGQWGKLAFAMGLISTIIGILICL